MVSNNGHVQTSEIEKILIFARANYFEVVSPFEWGFSLVAYMPKAFFPITF